MQRNRESAQRSRQKKLDLIEALNQENLAVEQSIALLQSELKYLLKDKFNFTENFAGVFHCDPFVVISSEASLSPVSCDSSVVSLLEPAVFMS